MPPKKVSRGENLRAYCTGGVVVELMGSEAFLGWERSPSGAVDTSRMRVGNMMVQLFDGAIASVADETFSVGIKPFFFGPVMGLADITERVIFPKVLVVLWPCLVTPSFTPNALWVISGDVFE